MGRLFGTDGVRGVANRDLTAELALALGRQRPLGALAASAGDSRRQRAGSRSSAVTRGPAARCSKPPSSPA